MMNVFSKPGHLELDGNLEEFFLFFKQQLDIFFATTKTNSEEEKVKITRVLNLIGREALRLYNSFKIRPNTPDEVLKRFEEYCVPKKNEILEYFRFFSRKQSGDETFEQFYTDIKALVAKCSFEVYEEKLLRSQLVIGLRDKNLQTRLLEEDIELDKVVKICQAMELAGVNRQWLQTCSKEVHDVFDGDQMSHCGSSKGSSVTEGAGSCLIDEDEIKQEEVEVENEYKLLDYDYSVCINDVIQSMVKEEVVPENNLPKKSLQKVANGFKNEASILNGSSSTVLVSDVENSEELFYESKYFKVGDYVDVKDYEHGAWLMGKLLKIIKNDSADDKSNDPRSSVKNDGLIYVVDILRSEDFPIGVPLQQIRPIASELLPSNELKCGDKVLTNYNSEYPKERGYWYDVLIKEIKPIKKNGFNIFGDVFIGMDNIVLEDCCLMFLDNIYKIKSYQLLEDRTADDDKIMKTEPTVLRFDPLYCIKCKDDMNKLCKNCGCYLCGGKDDEDKTLMCDECDNPYHMTCLKPPLMEMPDSNDDWYCPSCKNDGNKIVKAGDKLNSLKKETPKSTSKSKRDWGKSMACVGKTKKCNTVPKQHFGPIPGVEVGTTWMFRVQVSKAGVHRPLIAGIHGRENSGAFSIVLGGGYEDDVDYGDEFLYTGAGGRNLSGNKQSSDQKLTLTNRALAINCNAQIDTINGATAENWKQGKPVRVIRSYKLQKHSHFAPDKGNRYDGIYKVVKYYPLTGISGFIIWRFVLRRDDPIPAPWTPAGKKRMAELGLKIIYPDNHYDSLTNTKNKKSKLSGSNKKRTLHDTRINHSNKSESCLVNNNEKKCCVKKMKLLYILEKETEQLIIADSINKKYWDDCKKLLVKGKKEFLYRVKETFLCDFCEEIVYEPITTECSHNFCKKCLQRSFDADVFQCATCEAELGKTYPMVVNNKLAQILLLLFPGYTLYR